MSEPKPAATALSSSGLGARSRGPGVAALVLLLAAQLFMWAWSQEDLVVTAAGIGAVLADEGAARDEALRDAMRRAVEQAVGVAVSGRTLMVDLQVVEDRVSSKAEGFVRSYEVLEEARDNDVYRVSIEAVVQSELIASDLESIGALLRLSLGNPRVLVVATTDPGQILYPDAERYIIDHFVDLQFLTYNSSSLGAQAGRAGLFSTADLAAIAQQAQVDIIVVASVGMSDLGTTSVGNTSLVSARASVQLQAVLARTGQVLASRTAATIEASTQLVLARGNALRESLHELLPAFTQDMIRVLNDSVAGTGSARSVQVSVAGVADFLEALAVQDLLSRVRGVTSLQQRAFGNNTVTFDVQGSATTQDLAIRLVALEGLEITVVYLDAQRLEVVVEGR